MIERVIRAAFVLAALLLAASVLSKPYCLVERIKPMSLEGEVTGMVDGQIIHVRFARNAFYPDSQEVLLLPLSEYRYSDNELRRQREHRLRQLYRRTVRFTVEGRDLCCRTVASVELTEPTFGGRLWAWMLGIPDEPPRSMLPHSWVTLAPRCDADRQPLRTFYAVD